ncbi:MAG: redoxin domain-containing protein [Bacteroidales bacterium]|nr:redoxin domain-containing protein [Bacteroidales bacterium]
MRLKQLGATLALALICTLAYAKDGYKITVRRETAGSAATVVKESVADTALLFLNGWEKKIAVDSAVANKKGVYRFSGKKSLEPGEYTIKYGTKEIEILISEAGPVKENIVIESNGCRQAKGSAENRLFLEFQDLVNYKWKFMDDAAQVAAMIDTICSRAKSTLPGSLFVQMLEGYSNTPDYRTIFSDPRILSTRFGQKFIKEFFSSIEYNHTDSVTAGVVRLLDSAAEEVKPYIAAEAFRHFSKPSVMGQENVAYHIAQEYFNNGRLKVTDSGLDFEIRSFMMLNGKSLVGMEAQELLMQDTCGLDVSLKELVDQGEYTILYFYTDDCITCRIETPKLVEFVNEYNLGVINVFAVYTQDYTERWKSYINEKFNIYNPFVNWTNAADPQFESGFHLLYNVISTPQLYLIDNQGTIIGRDLSVKALKELIYRLKQNQDDLHLFFRNVFGPKDSIDDIRATIDRFAANSIHSPALFKEIVSELYSFLKYSDNFLLKEGALYLAVEHIMANSELWSKSYLERIDKDISGMSMNRPGEAVAEIALEDSAGRTFTLNSFAKKYKAICFYNSGCNSCLPEVDELNSIQKEFQSKEIEFITADICKNREVWSKFITNNHFEWVNLWVGKEDMHSKYYLGNLPVIYLIDSNNRVIARNLTPESFRKVIADL